MQSSPQSIAFDAAAIPERLISLKNQALGGLKIPGPWEISVKKYIAWHEANVSDNNLKAQFRQACDAALASGLDLELIFQDQYPSFFTDKEIMVGFARQFVRDIGRWAHDIKEVVPAEEAVLATT
ncbi:hypothetical protein F1880_008413 [Penicillium rolfsii]|nr:hypothetical protein F1880_008413 [Penicillium rolfsii]